MQSINSDKLFCQPSIEGSINIRPARHRNFIQVSSNSDFFKKPIKYSVKNGCIYFSRPGIFDDSWVVKPSKTKSKGWFVFTMKFIAQEIEFKKYFFDDESTDEIVIIYYL